MKILVMDRTAKVFSVECESADTIAHLNAKLGNIKGSHQSLMFDGKWLNHKFLENMMLVDVGVQDGSFILESCTCEYHSCGEPRRPENDYLHYADAFKSGWREEHAKALLNLLLELCQDGTLSEGNVTDEAWLRVQNSLNNSMKYTFQIDFLKERLCDYKQLYSVLAETTRSSFFKWDRERKIITIAHFNNWREEYPELLLLCGEHIPYFNTLEEVCLLVNTTRSSEQRVSETSTNINNAREASLSRGEICIRRPSGSNFSPMGSITSIEKENGYLGSTMKILVVDHETAKVFTLECESTDTIAHLRATLRKRFGNPRYFKNQVMFDGEELGGGFSENMTLADVGIQDGSLILDLSSELSGASGVRETLRTRPKNDYLYYADAFKSGWREEHAKALLHLLLKLCQDGTISEGNVTDEAWLRVQNSLNNSMKTNFQINFLKERLGDYMQLYSVLTNPANSWVFNWDRERKTITVKGNVWKKECPELLLLCGTYISYFDTLENVCSLLNTGRSLRIDFLNPLLSKFKSWFGKSQQS